MPPKQNMQVKFWWFIDMLFLFQRAPFHFLYRFSRPQCISKQNLLKMSGFGWSQPKICWGRCFNQGTRTGVPLTYVYPSYLLRPLGILGIYLGKHVSSIPFRIFPEQMNHHPRMVVTKKNLQKLWVNFQPTLNPQKDTRYRNPPETTRFPPWNPRS